MPHLKKDLFLLITAPYTVTTEPLAAPAVLFSILNDYYDTAFIDLNAEYNLQPNSILNDYFLYGTIQPGLAEKLNHYINNFVERVIEYKPTWVGISLFTMYGQRFTDLFCKTLKLHCPQIKIIIGGQGLSYNGINSTENFGIKLQNLGVIDTWIKSESESVLIDTLTGNNFVEQKQIENLDDLKFPCYDNYNFDLYATKSIPITGSRGCVRKCTFCDIHEHWKKFVYRSGSNIVDEMIHQQNKTKISHFSFTDSLVNGSMKSYRNMISLLSDYNNSSQQKITWSGQFILRPKNQMTENDWKLTKLSGVEHLAVGVESLIEHIRDDMGKKFSNEDIIFSLDQAQKYKITLVFLMIVGYVTETEQDHENQIQFFEKLVKYKDILQISLGTTLGILPGTPLFSNAQKWGIQLGKNENTWSVPSINNTYEIRIKRRTELENHLKQLGFINDMENKNTNPQHTMLDVQHNLMELWK